MLDYPDGPLQKHRGRNKAVEGLRSDEASSHSECDGKCQFTSPTKHLHLFQAGAVIWPALDTQVTNNCDKWELISPK